MKKDPRILLQHIMESIEQIEDYLVDVLEAEFMDSQQIQDAVLRRIGIIGEAAKNVPDDFKEQHPGVPWQKMAGMRNKIIHEYFNIDVPLVWDTAKNDIPKLKEQIAGLLEY
jgi:uncharacterized protein with HEPN domain